MLHLLAKLDGLGRQTIYGVLFVLCLLPFLVPIHLKPYVWREVRAAFDVTDACPPDKVVAIDSDWIGGSQGENWPQYEAVVSHCMCKGIKFVVFAMDADPQAPQIAEDINIRLARLYGREYGKDWVNLGLGRGAPLAMASMGRKITNIYPSDFYGTSSSDHKRLPLMAQVRGVKDFQCLWTISYQPDLNWLVFLDPTGQLPVIFCSAGIVTSSWYPYIASGQMRGMLPGVRGSAEYVQLLTDKYGDKYVQTATLKWKPSKSHTEQKGGNDVLVVDQRAQAVVLKRNGKEVAAESVSMAKDGWQTIDYECRGPKLYVPLSFGYLVIIGFVIIGNVGILAKRKLAGGKR